MRRKFEKVFIVSVVITLAVINLFAQTKTVTQNSFTEKERVEAEKLWEQIIEAKGGRKKLHSVTNMLMTQGDKPDNFGLGIYFYAFPNKYWDWMQGPPSRKVTWVAMLNLDYKIYLVASNEGLLRKDVFTKKEDIDNYKSGQFIDGCLYLLETKWLQPKPIRYERKKIGEEQLDVVETHLFDSTIGLDERMDFVVEPETLLVRWVVNYYKGKPLNHYYFDGYTNVDGIQMPLRYGNLRSFTDKKYFMPLNFQFNVEYDKQLFEKPPTVEAGSDAWKSKVKE